MGQEDLKKSDLKIVYDKSENVFSNIAQIKIFNDTVTLEVGIIDPDTKTANISHKIYMTVYQLGSLTEMCNRVMNDMMQFKEKQS